MAAKARMRAANVTSVRSRSRGGARRVRSGRVRGGAGRLPLGACTHSHLLLAGRVAALGGRRLHRAGTARPDGREPEARASGSMRSGRAEVGMLGLEDGDLLRALSSARSCSAPAPPSGAYRT